MEPELKLIRVVFLDMVLTVPRKNFIFSPPMGRLMQRVEMLSLIQQDLQSTDKLFGLKTPAVHYEVGFMALVELLRICS